MAEPLTQRQVQSSPLLSVALDQAKGCAQMEQQANPSSRHRGSLPPLSYLDTEKIKRETSVYNSYGVPTTNMSAPPLVSPSTTYSGPPPPYSYPSSAASSTIGGRESVSGPPPTSYGHSTESRHAYGDDKEIPPPPRQSLPPIREALSTAPNISINSLLSNSTTSSDHRPPYPAQSPTSPTHRNYLDNPPRGPTESFPQEKPASYGPYESHERSTRTAYSPKIANSYSFARSPAVTTNSSMQPPRTVASPTRPGATAFPNHQPLSPRSTLDQLPRSGPPASSYEYKPNYQPAYSYPPTTPGAASYTSPPSQGNPWRNADFDRAEEIRRAAAKNSPPPRAAYGESVKRHLDIFDIETSLNEIAEGSGRALDFANNYGARAHQTQRSGPMPGSLPTLIECDDIMRHQQRVLDSMARIRDLIQRQQQALAEQRIYDAQNFKTATSETDEDGQSYMEKMDGAGGFAGAEAKKRRGRAAPPGRCHSCNRAETPEWRRGPDGARTLCNACGLHYAKLQRKMDSKDSSAGPSKLRPKESTGSSP